MKIPLDEARIKVKDLMSRSGFSAEDAETFTELVIDQELIGNTFSAIGELAGKHQRLLKGRDANAEVVVNLPALKLVKGNGRPACLITNDFIPELVKSAQQNGICALGIYDSTYNEFLDLLCRKVAAQDCIAILTSNGGPQGVVPFGGKKDILGTNPLAYAVPTEKDPIVFDAATAMHAWGLIRLRKEKGDQLPPEAYLDKEGNPTTDPNVANAILPFGGYKGYAINLLMEVLSGALVGAKSGLDVPMDDPDGHIGTFMIVISPAVLGDVTEFKKATSKLAADLLAVPPADSQNPVRVPGFRGAARRKKQLEEGFLEVNDEDWNKFNQALQEI